MRVKVIRRGKELFLPIPDECGIEEGQVFNLLLGPNGEIICRSVEEVEARFTTDKELDEISEGILTHYDAVFKALALED